MTHSMHVQYAYKPFICIFLREGEGRGLSRYYQREITHSHL